MSWDRQGLINLHEQAEAFSIVLGDQPGIGLEIYNRLIDEFIRVTPQKNIVLPAYQRRGGHPALFGVKYQKEALRLKENIGLREILYKYPEDILTVEMGIDSILQDIDTPADYWKQLHSK